MAMQPMTGSQLTLRYVLALSLVAVLAGALLALAQFSAHDAGSDGQLINEAGRQRMLSQRLALLATQPEAFRGEAVSEFDRALDLFSQSHERLVVRARTRPALASIYDQGPWDVDWTSRVFIAAAHAARQDDFGPGTVNALFIASQNLLPRLNTATYGFEQEAQARVAGFQRMEWIAFGLTILTLIAEAVLIFRPAANSIERAMKHLKDAREAADRANAAKTDFLAQMSHEIRTPLNGVLGMASGLRDTPLDERQTEMVSTICSSGDLLLSVVNDVLDLSKIEAGEIELEAVDMSLVQIVDWTVSAFRPACVEKRITIESSVDPSAEGWYRGDPTRVRQILSNLVSNAIKFTQIGTVSISVRCSTNPGDETDRVEICVADTGIGVPAHKLQTIFQAFTQADSSTTRAYGGTGLGLPICKKLATLMGGEISVRSRPGCGSIFTVALRLPRTEAPVIKVTQPSTKQSERPFTVLIVDDVSTNRLVLQTMLAKHNVDVIPAASGLEALAAVELRGDIDAVLMDIQMPDMDGVEATRRIRALEAGFARPPVPIAAVTANVLSNQVAEYKQAGMDLHLAKPIDPRQLTTMLAAIRERLDGNDRLRQSA